MNPMTRNIACKIYYVIKIFMQSKCMIRHKTFFRNWGAGYKKMCKRFFTCPSQWQDFMEKEVNKH